METKRPLMILFVILLVFGLAACTRSLSGGGPTKPAATSPAGGAGAGATDVMSQLELFVTQTALATMQQGQAGGQATQAATPVPGAQPATPVPGTEATQPALPTLAPAPQQPTATQAPPQPAQPTATFPPVPTATPGIPSSYTLQSGEYPYCIARRFNVNAGELLNLNGLGPSTLVYPGTTLRIPQTGNTFGSNRALTAHPASYTVRSGDTVYSVACQFGDVSPEAIAFANGLSAPFKLSAGQTLRIP